MNEFAMMNEFTKMTEFNKKNEQEGASPVSSSNENEISGAMFFSAR